MKRLTIAGLIAALAVGSFVLVAAAQVRSLPPVPGMTPAPAPQPPRATFWPTIKGGPVVGEWYSDIPWTQKLGTYRGNEIDEALVVPYDALGQPEKDFCGNPTDPAKQSACMIEIGINSILGTYRTDTPYNTLDSKIQTAKECQTRQQPCIEVNLQASILWSRSTGCQATSPCARPRPFGILPLKWRTNYGEYYKGYVINDGGSYAPQMPWYMAHYCDSKLTRDAQDPVCYADYLSPMNVGFNWLPMTGQIDWPKSAPFSVFPMAPAPATSNTCPAVQTTCQLVLAGFDLSPVPQSLDDSSPSYKPYRPYNKFLFDWFNTALTQFPNNFTDADFSHHFPWRKAPQAPQVTWATDRNSPTDLYYQALPNPFLGQFTSVNGLPAVVNTDRPAPSDCLGDGFTPSNPPNVFPAACDNTGNMRAGHYLYPRQCTLADLATTDPNVVRLRACGLNYELHSAGWLEEWRPYVCADTSQRSCGAGDYSWWAAVKAADMNANQYGRTSFLFAGVPGMQLPVSFGKIPGSVSGLSVYEQVHNASIFDQYLAIANEADLKNAFNGRNYGDPSDFYHTLLMINHMESDPDEFAEGIRGKVLWHNEYRTRKMYGAKNPLFGARTFAASFDPMNANAAPFHNNTCDGCHVRNGSGIPINTTNTLDATLQPPQGFMTGDTYNPYGSRESRDYTFTGQITPMKLVFFDSKRSTNRLLRSTIRFDDSSYSKPLAASQAAQAPIAVKTADPYYNNTIMNFYGDSFHVTRTGYGMVGNGWSYVPAKSNRIVVNTDRFNRELNIHYVPQQVSLGTFTTPGSGCQFAKQPDSMPPWPASCADIDSAAIHRATDEQMSPPVGFMLLNGKRLGNLSAIEAIPNTAIVGFRQNQISVLGQQNLAGEIQYNAGSRDGVGGPYSLVKECRIQSDCYIGRFGWLGDRVSIEDQVANAAFIEMNMTTTAGYNGLNGNVMFPIRYDRPNCGPADQKCNGSGGNGDLSEKDINRMASYARWLGNPTRSEFMASLPDVIAGEKLFNDIKCSTCHVISKIEIVDQDDTMLTKYFRDRLAKHIDKVKKVYPFLSYLGTDLLMHDMGYLSQVGNTSGSISIRDSDGVVLAGSQDFVQKIRTPALKGLRFNRFATESQTNTKSPCFLKPTDTCDPGCDFLLHDGRACDAIEAAFLHDGPAIKKLGVIDGIPGCIKNSGNECGLNDLSVTQLQQLRAFLYSL
jgi:Di-haem oxidoreductase, putative peroxidase